MKQLSNWECIVLPALCFALIAAGSITSCPGGTTEDTRNERAGGRATVAIVIGKQATAAERIASEELRVHLSSLYPDEKFRVVARSPVDRCSLVEAMPKTGRLHQIRRHLRHINHPLVGDVKHGSGVINRHYRAEYGLHRLALHAHRISFAHPVTGTIVSVTAPIPEDLGRPLALLGVHTP